MDPVSAVANALGAISGVLPSLGIGSKSRQNEIAAMGEVNLELADAKSKSYTKYLVISGVLILLITVIFLTLRKK